MSMTDILVVVGFVLAGYAIYNCFKLIKDI